MTHDSAVVGAAWSQDGARVLTWSRDKRACIWDASSGQIAAGTACMLHSEAVLGAAWNPDETRVLTWTRDNFLRIWDDSGNLLHEIEHPRTVQGARWSPNGTEILSWAGGDSVLVWNAETGEQIADLPHGTSIQGVKGAVWNHDGSRILSWSSNGVVRIWALPGHGTALADDESPLRATMNHSRIVSGAMWNQDETRVLSWSSDDTARIWDVSIDNDPEELFVLEHSDAVGGALWNTAETRVLTWSRSSLREWVVDVDTLISTARSRFVQPFSNEERERFFLPTLAPTLIAPTPTKYG